MILGLTHVFVNLCWKRFLLKDFSNCSLISIYFFMIKISFFASFSEVTCCPTSSAQEEQVLMHCSSGICIICKHIMNILSKMHVSKSVNALWSGSMRTTRWDQTGYESGLSRAQTQSQIIQNCVPISRRISWGANGGLEKDPEESMILNNESSFTCKIIWFFLSLSWIVSYQRARTPKCTNFINSDVILVWFFTRNLHEYFQIICTGSYPVFLQDWTRPCTSSRSRVYVSLICRVGYKSQEILLYSPPCHYGHSGGVPRTRFPHLCSVFRFLSRE